MEMIGFVYYNPNEQKNDIKKMLVEWTVRILSYAVAYVARQ